jgi:hypothetical protein
MAMKNMNAHDSNPTIEALYLRNWWWKRLMGKELGVQ